LCKGIPDYIQIYKFISFLSQLRVDKSRRSSNEKNSQINKPKKGTQEPKFSVIKTINSFSYKNRQRNEKKGNYN